MQMQRNIKLLQFYTVLSGALFFIPIMLPYYRDEIGLGFKDLMIGEAVFAAVLVILEVPSGWISDVWKRKYVLVIAMIFDLASYFFLLFADSLIMVLIAQGLFGVGYSLISGTNSAMLYDSLLADKKENTYSKLEGKRHGLGLYSVGIASIIGGITYTFDHNFPIYLSMISCIFALVVALMMHEPAREKSAIQGHPITDMLYTMRYAVHGHVEVGLIILFTAALFCATKLLMWMQQPYYVHMNIPEGYFGILMAIGFLLGGISSHFSHLLERYTSNIQAFILGWGIVLFVCILSGFLMNYVGIAILMIGGSCIYGMLSPRINDAINRRVASDRRATILSTMNLLSQIFFIPLSIFIGWTVEQYGVPSGLDGIAAWVVLSGICLILWSIRRLKKR